MMMPFIKMDDLLSLKKNISVYTDHFAEDTNEWIEKEMGYSVFSDSKYPMPEVHLDTSFEKEYDSDAVNIRTFYDHFKFLTDAQASDERLWAGLCLGPFWNYVQYRWKIKSDHSESSIRQHYFFGFGARRSLTRNALSRLWWTARLTYDSTASEPYELTDYVGRHSRLIVDILERNTSNNIDILRPFIHAIMDAEKEGIAVSSDNVRTLEIYLDELGGLYLLDCLPEKTIYSKVLKRAEAISGK